MSKAFEQPLFANPETRLYLETDDYLKQACIAELDHDLDALYDAIKPEP